MVQGPKRKLSGRHQRGGKVARGPHRIEVHGGERNAQPLRDHRGEVLAQQARDDQVRRGAGALIVFNQFVAMFSDDRAHALHERGYVARGEPLAPFLGLHEGLAVDGYLLGPDAALAHEFRQIGRHGERYVVPAFHQREGQNGERLNVSAGAVHKKRNLHEGSFGRRMIEERSFRQA
jgi:hypothetical protein